MDPETARRSRALRRVFLYALAIELLVVVWATRGGQKDELETGIVATLMPFAGMFVLRVLSGLVHARGRAAGDLAVAVVAVLCSLFGSVLYLYASPIRGIQMEIFGWVAVLQILLGLPLLVLVYVVGLLRARRSAAG